MIHKFSKNVIVDIVGNGKIVGLCSLECCCYLHTGRDVTHKKFSYFVGQKFAMMELKVILASLLLNFNIETTQRRSELRSSSGIIVSLSSWPQESDYWPFIRHAHWTMQYAICGIHIICSNCNSRQREQMKMEKIAYHINEYLTQCYHCAKMVLCTSYNGIIVLCYKWNKGTSKWRSTAETTYMQRCDNSPFLQFKSIQITVICDQIKSIHLRP